MSVHARMLIILVGNKSNIAPTGVASKTPHFPEPRGQYIILSSRSGLEFFTDGFELEYKLAEIIKPIQSYCVFQTGFRH